MTRIEAIQKVNDVFDALVEAPVGVAAAAQHDFDELGEADSKFMSKYIDIAGADAVARIEKRIEELTQED